MIYYIGETSNEFENSTIQECLEYLDGINIVGLDIETSFKFNGRYEGEGLDPHLSTICMLQIGTEERQYVIDARCTDLTLLKGILEDESVLKVGHNIKFEYKHLLNHGIRLRCVYDTMIAEQILFAGLRFPKAGIEVNGKIENFDGYSLRDLVYRYFKKILFKGTRLEFSRIKNRPFTSTQIKYGAEDVVLPLQLFNKHQPNIDRKDVRNCVDLESLFIPVLGDIEYKGMYFDTEIWTDTYLINLKEFQQKEQELFEYVVEHHYDSKFIDKQLDLFSTDDKCRIKWTSPAQVAAFFEYLSICPTKHDKSSGKKSLTVDAKVLKSSLKTFNKDIPPTKKELIHIYLKYKELQKACTTYGIDFFKYINPITKRLHSNYKQILQTGRISSSGPNLQNIPAVKGFRSAFNCADGDKIVNADYSGQEQIILANKSQDKDLISFYSLGSTDMHSFIASKINDKPFEDYITAVKLNKAGKNLTNHQETLLKERQIAKGAGFAINYGGDGHTISKNLGISEAQGKAVYDAYFKSFPNLKKYFNKVQNESLMRGYILIDPITGRKNWFKEPKTDQAKGEIKRHALNYPIQGEAGGITKYAPILFRRWILDNNLENDVFITNIVHDEINVESTETYAEEVAKNLERCMAEAGDKWCKIVSLNAKAVVTEYWNH